MNIQDKFLYASILSLDNSKYNINKSNMILLKPNFKYLIPNEKINKNNYDSSFFFDLKDIKKVKNINSKKFISSGYPYLVLVRDRGLNDNIILVLTTPKLRYKQVGGSINIDLGAEDHNPNQYPADAGFGVDIDTMKEDYKNYENGFSKGFDSGYHKGYYFGYTAASAYLYRFYKKYYSDYMEKYQSKIKNLANQQLNDRVKALEILNKQYDKNKPEPIQQNEDINLDTLPPVSPELEENIESDENFQESENFTDASDFGEGDINEGEMYQDDMQGGGNKKHYNYSELNTKNPYDGLPLYMLPSNHYILEALVGEKNGIFKFIDLILNPPNPHENPLRHCKKPNKKKLDDILRKKFDQRFRSAIIGSNDNWDQKIFNRSCNRDVLKYMKYCNDATDPGIEFNERVGKFTKNCKVRKDSKGLCNIM